MVNYFNYFLILVYLAYAVKIFFLIFAIYDRYLHKRDPNNPNTEKIETMKDVTEFIFKILMAIILIYLFNPRYKKEIKFTYELKLLLYVFGFLTIFTSDWSKFIEDIKKILQIRNTKRITKKNDQHTKNKQETWSEIEIIAETVYT